MLGALAALLVTIGVMMVVLRWLGRLHGINRGGERTGTLQLLDRVATGPRQGIGLVRVGERVLIVGMGEELSLLGEIEGPAREDLLRTASPRDGTPARGLPHWLGRFGLLLALAVGLALAPVVVAAQVVTAPPPTAQAATPAATPGGLQGPSITPPIAPSVDLRLGDGEDQLRLSGAVGIVVLMGVLTLLPAMLLLMTGFTRILIVLGFLRSALGTQSAPPAQLLVAIALILTGLVMRPVINEANETALQPYLRGEMTQVDAYKAALVPARRFMLANTRDKDIRTFVELAGESEADSLEAVSTMTIVSAFVTSELRTAFQMGFVIFLPFLVIDLIVASVLMSMGMFMLPPVMVSLPFKLLLFVLADGWALVMQGLVASFRVAG
ncbi:MAG TPA: flagellar type III secretion system pore protein FliP [Gemmatimonadales bacterium]|nr:flagellar type III secretion system pore protein FliP [Gemmatimonadales bacterium]